MRSLIGKRCIWNALTQNCNNSIANRRSFTTGTRFGGLNLHSSSNLLSRSPWSLSQQRGAKSFGSDLRVGNFVQRKGRIYQVLKAQHTQHGRGGASIQVELRDIEAGNKLVERFRPDEAVLKVSSEEKQYTYLYTEGDALVLMDPESFEQVEVSKDLFGKAAAYLKDDMTVKVRYYNEKPVSASVPNRVTCKVVEAETIKKGSSVNPAYKRVVLDNGMTVLVPPFIEAGELVVISTLDDSYMARANE